MPARSVHVLHALFARRIGGETQVFLHIHPRWREAPTGRPMLALPATKLAAQSNPDAIDERLGSVVHTDLALTEAVPAGWRQLPEVETRTVSPTHGVPSDYHIAPVLGRLPATAHRRATQRVGGVWLSPRAALARPDLSPTARAVLGRVDASDLLPPAPPPAEFEAGGERALRARLTAARDGDLNEFGTVVEAVRPVLVERLRSTSCTRVLATRTHDIEDVIADAFTAALKHLETFDPLRGSPTGWLWTIARNAAVSRLRRKSPSALTPEVEVIIASSAREPVDLASEDEDVGDLRSRLATVLGRVPPMICRAWAMRADEGQPYEAIAEALDVPLGTVATWIRRIRQQVACETGRTSAT